MKLLIIEDNPRLAETMQRQLQKWYIIEIADSGDAGLRLASSLHFDLILLDLGLPDIPGLEVCKQLRSISQDTPILVVTGIDTTDSRVSLLDSGADDYITKPFQIAELRSRINALARRRGRGISTPLIIVGNLTIEPSSRKVVRSGKVITLRRKEFDILEYLATHVGRVMTREMIVNHAWATNSASWTGSVDVHIKQLRDKVDKPFDYPLIKTSYGIGYMIEIPEEITQRKEVQNE